MRALLICLTLLSVGCTKKVTGVEQNSTYNSNNFSRFDQTIEEALGKENLRSANESKTFTLVYQNNVSANEYTRYIVVNNADGSVIHKGSFRAGYVKWKNDTSLEIFDVPGIIPKEKNQADYIKIVNLRINKQ